MGARKQLMVSADIWAGIQLELQPLCTVSEISSREGESYFAEASRDIYFSYMSSDEHINILEYRTCS